jgi:TolB protein
MSSDLPGDLRDSLHDLAGTAEPVDLYDRAMRRSRGIARREAAVGGSAALVALAALTSGLWWLPGRPNDTPPQAGSVPVLTPGPLRPDSVPPSQPHTFASPHQPGRVIPSPRRSPHRPHTTDASPPAQSGSLADLAGHVFYERTGASPDVVRFSPGDRTVETVLADPPSPVGVSPDGDKIAYTDDGGLFVQRTGDAEAEQVADGVTTTDQAPVWSPTGDRLLVDLDAPAVVDVESGAVTRLPAGLTAGGHLSWSADGSTPVRAATRMPVPQVTLPVTGTVVGKVTTPDGDLLVRTVNTTGTHLALIGKNNTLLVEADEPPALRDLNLLAYTR